MNNKQIGLITESEVRTALLKCNCRVSNPEGDNSRYDLIADVDGTLLRIQVKSSHTRDGGNSFEFYCASHYLNMTGQCVRTYTKDEIDYFATVWKYKAYLIPVEECHTKKQLRIRPTKNNRNADINWAVNYEMEKVIDDIRKNARRQDT